MIGLAFALFSGFFQSLGDMLIKKNSNNVDPDLVGFSWFLFSLPLGFVVIAFTGVPPIQNSFWIGVIGSGSLNILAVMLYTRALRASPISKSVPMLSFTPVFLLITSPLFLGEFPSQQGLVGIVFIVGGAYLLNFNKMSKGILKPFTSIVRDRGTVFMLLVAVIFSIASNFDKIGVINSNPMFYIVMVFSYITAGLTVILFVRKKFSRKILTGNIKTLAPLGISSFGIGFFAATAMLSEIVPYIIALKRTSIIYSSIFGFILFKEKEIKQRMIAISLMLVGVFLIFI